MNEEKQLDDYSKSSNLRRVFYKLRYFLGKRARAQLSELFSIGPEKSSQGLREILKSELLRKAQLCVRILALFWIGSLILDEVDFVLHPLKSELNWPLGRKNAFDFTDNSEESNARSLPEELVVTCRYAVASCIFSS